MQMIIRNGLIDRIAASSSSYFKGNSTKHFTHNGTIQALFFSSKADEIRQVCIVGSGPAGFYTAKYLLREHKKVHVTMLEKLPTPFGLVRSGVAPDHPEVKSVINDFKVVASSPRVSFFGNVSVGKDISISDLKLHFDAVVLCYGASKDKLLGIPGENLKGIHSARAFVNWYNGHPSYANLNVELKNTTTAVVIGQGNVAIDCARILIKGVGSELASTDIADHAVKKLQGSSIRKVSVLGRRGSAQAAFTMKELREVTKLKSATCVVRKDELEASLTCSSKVEIESQRSRKRMNDFLSKMSGSENSIDGHILEIRFLCSPVAFLPDPSDPSRVGAVRIERTVLTGPPHDQRAASTGEIEDISCSLVLRSIGYASESISEKVPLDPIRCVVPNIKGRVLISVGDSSEVMDGVYVSGWLKRGPSGIIGTNIQDARETVASILCDLKKKRQSTRSILPFDVKEFVPSAITWDQILRVLAFEEYQGKAVGKPCEKIVSIPRMLEIAHKHDEKESN